MTLTWPNTYLEQADEITALLARIEAVDRQVAPATFIDSSEPVDDVDLSGAWAIKKGGDSTIPDNSKTHWYNPSTGQVENVFAKIAAVSPFAQPLIGRQQDPAIEVISSLFIDAAVGAQATWTLTIPNNYHSVHIIGQMRSDQAAASTTLVMRYNSVATANYRTRIHRAIPASTFAGVTVANQTDVFNGAFLVPAATTLNNVFAAFHFDYYLPTKKAHCFGMWSSFVDDGGASEQQVATFGSSLNSAGALTSVLFDLAGGNFTLGSWFIAYGVNRL